MSGIVGVRRLDSRPVDPALLARMANAIAHRGPDGEGQWADGIAGLHHRLLRTTPESLGEKQPVADERGDCRLVFDGRLDNRRELIAGLGLDDRDRPDPELVLSAYRRWGEQSFGRLVGDFALAIWDGRARRLVCVRDPFGAKPFYYHANGERFAFGSEIVAILADPAVRVRPDEATIADFLLMDFRDHEASPFERVKQIPPGHVLLVDDCGLRTRRYWDMDGCRETRYPRQADYLERFRELFREAVRSRLRSHAPVAALLSGGIDSTAVVSMAEALRRGDPGLPPVLAVTLLDDGVLREDRDAIETVQRAYGTNVRAVAPLAKGRHLTDLELFCAPSEILHYEGFPAVPLATELATNRGCRSLLTGFGADELIGSAELGFLQDLLWAGSVFRFRREVRRLAVAYGSEPAPGVAELAWARLPRRARTLIKRALGRNRPDWLAPAFARRVAGRDRGASAAPRFRTRCQEASYRAVTAPSLALALTWMDSTAAAQSLESRHPFLDRRLVEFFLSIPTEPKVEAGYRKMFLQQALGPISPVPPRRTLTDETVVAPMPDETWRALDAEWLRASLFRPDALVFEYVDRCAAHRMRDRYLAGDAQWRGLLRRFALLELWLQRFFGTRA